jgi:tRNA1Val (adenine37-N6)-methyltransferase
MPNSFFRFKQFTIFQDQCAMKVSTDACILGAWFAQKIRNNISVLDIGSGTGLLMLMLAQKKTLKIDGIELDHSAWVQLKENLASSQWKNELAAFEGDARNFNFPKKYDFIISNPPFFENDLPSPSLQKNQAKHNISMTFSELLRIIEQQLKVEGSFGLLLPYRRIEEFIRICISHQFFLVGKLMIRPTHAHDYFRAILHFSRTDVELVETEELIIRDELGYTHAFTALMKDYYLYL